MLLATILAVVSAFSIRLPSELGGGVTMQRWGCFGPASPVAVALKPTAMVTATAATRSMADNGPGSGWSWAQRCGGGPKAAAALDCLPLWTVAPDCLPPLFSCFRISTLQCRALRNFSSLYAILSALQSNSIYRLKRTWAAVNRDTRSSFRKLSQIFSEDHNHLNCREILLQEGDAQGPCDGWRNHQTPVRTSLKTPTIPYLGTFLTDLIMLDTALPDFVEVSIFERGLKEGEEECGEHLEAAILFCICHLQQSCQGYNLCQNPSFHLAFHHQRQLSEDQSYYISCMIEPPADSCPNSPKLHRSLTKCFKVIPVTGKRLLLSSEPPATPSGSEKTGTMPLGSSSSLNSEGGSSVPSSPTWVSPGVKDPPVTLWKTCPLHEQPVLPSISKQGETESRIVRVHMNNICGNGNLYRSIL
ncbi:hypothetical protein E2320_000152, partial [Naja naja]